MPEPVHPGPYRVHCGLERPVPIHTPAADYTEAAYSARLQGVVIIETLIDREGRVESAEVLRGLPLGLSERALETVRTWRYSPATLRGVPVSVYYNVTVNFQLPKSTQGPQS